MKRRYRVIAGILVGFLLAPVHGDDAAGGVTVLGVRFATAGEYDADGALLQDIKSELIPVGAAVVEQNESLGIVKVQLADRQAWISAADLKLSKAAPPPCLKEAASAASDKTNVFVSGVGEGNCVRETDANAPPRK
jgi:hypothetical protein